MIKFTVGEETILLNEFFAQGFMLNMGHKSLVFQTLRTQMLTNMPCKGFMESPVLASQPWAA